jgi:lipopolysaccharide export system permease protein
LDADNQFVARLDANTGVLQAGSLRLNGVKQVDALGGRETLPEIVIATEARSDDIARQFVSPDSAHVFELPRLIETARTLGLPMNGFATRFHALLALPFLLVAMTLIAAAVSIRFSRAGQSLVVAITGIAAGFVFYVVSTVAAASGTVGVLPPEVAAWLPVILAACLSVVSLLHTEDG